MIYTYEVILVNTQLIFAGRFSFKFAIPLLQFVTVDIFSGRLADSSATTH
jgi:hypothetical protein